MKIQLATALLSLLLLTNIAAAATSEYTFGLSTEKSSKLTATEVSFLQPARKATHATEGSIHSFTFESEEGEKIFNSIKANVKYSFCNEKMPREQEITTNSIKIAIPEGSTFSAEEFAEAARQGKSVELKGAAITVSTPTTKTESRSLRRVQVPCELFAEYKKGSPGLSNIGDFEIRINGAPISDYFLPMIKGLFKGKIDEVKEAEKPREAYKELKKEEITISFGFSSPIPYATVDRQGRKLHQKGMMTGLTFKGQLSDYNEPAITEGAKIIRKAKNAEEIRKKFGEWLSKGGIGSNDGFGFRKDASESASITIETLSGDNAAFDAHAKKYFYEVEKAEVSVNGDETAFLPLKVGDVKGEDRVKLKLTVKRTESTEEGASTEYLPTAFLRPIDSLGIKGDDESYHSYYAYFKRLEETGVPIGEKIEPYEEFSGKDGFSMMEFPEITFDMLEAKDFGGGDTATVEAEFQVNAKTQPGMDYELFYVKSIGSSGNARNEIETGEPTYLRQLNSNQYETVSQNMIKSGDYLQLGKAKLAFNALSDNGRISMTYGETSTTFSTEMSTYDELNLFNAGNEYLVAFTKPPEGIGLTPKELEGAVIATVLPVNARNAIIRPSAFDGSETNILHLRFYRGSNPTPEVVNSFENAMETGKVSFVPKVDKVVFNYVADFSPAKEDNGMLFKAIPLKFGESAREAIAASARTRAYQTSETKEAAAFRVISVELKPEEFYGTEYWYGVNFIDGADLPDALKRTSPAASPGFYLLYLKTGGLASEDAKESWAIVRVRGSTEEEASTPPKIGLISKNDAGRDAPRFKVDEVARYNGEAPQTPEFSDENQYVKIAGEGRKTQQSAGEPYEYTYQVQFAGSTDIVPMAEKNIEPVSRGEILSISSETRSSPLEFPIAVPCSEIDVWCRVVLHSPGDFASLKSAGIVAGDAGVAEQVNGEIIKVRFDRRKSTTFNLNKWRFNPVEGAPITATTAEPKVKSKKPGNCMEMTVGCRVVLIQPNKDAFLTAFAITAGEIGTVIENSEGFIRVIFEKEKSVIFRLEKTRFTPHTD